MLISGPRRLELNAKREPALPPKGQQKMEEPVERLRAVAGSPVTRSHSSQLLRRELPFPAFFFLLMKRKLDALPRPTQPAVKVTPCLTS